MLKSAIPILHVTNSSQAEAFYARLGFRVLFAYRPGEHADPGYLGLARDGVILHISSFSGDHGSDVYIIVEDIDRLHDEFLSLQVAIDLPPTDQTWGNREMYVRDPDGNSLRFVQPQPACP